MLRHGGHDVILFHILDEAEVHFPFDGVVEFEEPETEERIQVDATGYREEYLQEVAAFASDIARVVFRSASITWPWTPSMQFDKALMEYLLSRRGRC